MFTGKGYEKSSEKPNRIWVFPRQSNVSHSENALK